MCGFDSFYTLVGHQQVDQVVGLAKNQNQEAVAAETYSVAETESKEKMYQLRSCLVPRATLEVWRHGGNSVGLCRGAIHDT